MTPSNPTPPQPSEAQIKAARSILALHDAYYEGTYGEQSVARIDDAARLLAADQARALAELTAERDTLRAENARLTVELEKRRGHHLDTIRALGESEMDCIVVRQSLAEAEGRERRLRDRLSDAMQAAMDNASETVEAVRPRLAARAQPAQPQA